VAAGKACAGWFNLEFGMRIKHFLLTPLAFAAIGAAALAQDTAKPAEEPLPDAPQATAAVQIQPNGPTVVMDTSMGRITCHLFQKEAPKTVENFIALAEGKKDGPIQRRSRRCTTSRYTTGLCSIASFRSS